MFVGRTPAAVRMNRIRVKICGLTNAADALAAIDGGADALGFNFWPGSKRFVESADSLPWIVALPAAVTRVAVMVDPDFSAALRVLESPGIDALQLHGNETPEFCVRLVAAGHRIIKAIRVRDEESLTQALRFPIEIPLLLDAYKTGEPGGTGTTLDWRLATDFVRDHPDRRVLLSGGLTPENVTDAARRVRPFAMDVASGVEVPGQPRRKDPSRLRAFLTAIQTANSDAHPDRGENSPGLY